MYTGKIQLFFLLLILIGVFAGFYLISSFHQILTSWSPWVSFPVFAIITGFVSWLTAPIRISQILVKAVKPIRYYFIENMVILIDVSRVALKNVLAMEESLPSIENTYLRNGLRLVVDKVNRKMIESCLQSELDSHKEFFKLTIKEIKWTVIHILAVGIYLSSTLLIVTNGELTNEAGLLFLSSLLCIGCILFLVSFYLKNFHLKLQENRMIKEGILLIQEMTESAMIEHVLMNYLPAKLKVYYDKTKFAHSQE